MKLHQISKQAFRLAGISPDQEAIVAIDMIAFAKTESEPKLPRGEKMEPIPHRSPKRVRECADAGMTAAETADALGTTRDKIMRLAAYHRIKFGNGRLKQETRT